MAGRAKRIPNPGNPPPYQTWLLTVEKGKGERPCHRIRLPREVGLLVTWLRAAVEPIECVCALGPAGGVVIVPATLVASSRRSLDSLISDRVSVPWEVSGPRFELARYFAHTWDLSVQVDQSRFTLTVPEDVRKLGRAPSGGELAVVFAIGDILEIWRADAWCDHIRQVANSFNELRGSALDASSSSSGDE